MSPSKSLYTCKPCTCPVYMESNNCSNLSGRAYDSPEI
jgi:hypothetical protein